MDLIFSLVVLILSVILHEVAHGYMANWLGDPTARLQGRLTLNPLSHIDPVGSILLPALLVFTKSSFLIGYAKPVPYNPHNLSGKYDEALVAGAGPATNLLLALVFALCIRFGAVAMTVPMLSAFGTIVYINLMLALFNLIPIPPLDGSKILSGILPGGLGRTYELFRHNFERIGLFSNIIIVYILFILFQPYFTAALQGLFGLLTGVSI